MNVSKRRSKIATSSGKPSKYRHERFKWFDWDMDSGCTKKVRRCPKGYRGHLTSQLNQNVRRIVQIDGNDELELQVIQMIAHSHFTHETDLCRHLTCEIGRTWILAKNCRTVYALDRRILPEWVRRDLYGE